MTTSIAVEELGLQTPVDLFAGGPLESSVSAWIYSKLFFSAAVCRGKDRYVPEFYCHHSEPDSGAWMTSVRT
jgi:hypothetical protein